MLRTRFQTHLQLVAVNDRGPRGAGGHEPFWPDIPKAETMPNTTNVTKKKRTGRNHSPEFKASAVELAMQGGSWSETPLRR